MSVEEGTAPAIVTPVAEVATVVAEEIVKAVEQPAIEVVSSSTQVSKDDPKIASRLAHLSKKEREIQRQNEDIKVRLKEIETGNQRLSSFEEKKLKAKENPIDFMREMGIEFEDVVNFVTEKGGLTPVPDPVQKELESLREMVGQERKEREKLVQEAEEAKTLKRKTEEQALYTNYVNVLQKDLENYPLTKVYTPVEQIVEIVDRHYQDTGIVMTNEQVLQLIEDEWDTKIEAIKDLPKIKARFGSREVPSQPVVEIPVETVAVKQPAVTLSNKVGSGVVTKSLDEMDLDERKALASSMLKKANKK